MVFFVLVLDDEELCPLLAGVTKVVAGVTGDVEGVSLGRLELIVVDLHADLSLQHHEDGGVAVSLSDPLAGVGSQPHIAGNMVGRSQSLALLDSVGWLTVGVVNVGPHVVSVGLETFNTDLSHYLLSPLTHHQARSLKQPINSVMELFYELVNIVTTTSTPDQLLLLCLYMM